MRFLIRCVLLLILSASQCGFAEETELETKPYIIFIYGPRGSGRGVLSIRLRQDFAFPGITLAPIVSNHILEETPLGIKAREYLLKGVTLPTELSLAILYERLSQPDCQRGVIFEEFPPTVEYYEAMKEHLSSYFSFLAIRINAGEDWLVDRAEHRLVCRTCGKVYVEPTSPAKHKGYCDICLEQLRRRLDDSPEVIKARVQSYTTQMNPLFAAHQMDRILIEIAGDRKLEDIYRDIANAIEVHTGVRGARSDSNQTRN